MEERIEREYAAALNFLSERTKFGVNLGLGRMEVLLELLGNPHEAGVKFIHIGGTNGKGSTAAMLAAILQAAGYKTGLFSSPHLHSYRERFRIDGRPADKQTVTRLLLEMREPLAEMDRRGLEQPTEFEVSTALGFRYFAEAQVDYAVIEVGMGGNFDSTNVITPELAMITNVAMDHMAYLGDTVAEIAETKAGIIKPGVWTLTAAEGEALAVIRRYTETLGCPFSRLGADFGVEPKQAGLDGQSFDWILYDWLDGSERVRLADLRINLLGRHQLANAALAVMAAYGLKLPEQAIRQGLAQASWPGRLERIADGGQEILLDGAHNVAGMQALAAALRQYWPGRRIVAVLGMLADKERAEALRELLPLIDRAVITRVPSYRAGDWQTLAQVCEEAGVPVCCVEKVPEAVSLGRESAGADSLLLVTGSLYMLAEARAFLLGIEQEEY